jgi:hypothetical protein
LLRGAGAVAALAGAGGADALLGSSGQKIPRISSFPARRTGPVRAFHSRPDLRPPLVTSTAERTAEAFGREDSDAIPGDPNGFLFLAPGPISLEGSKQYGPLIVDREGEPVWFRPLGQGLEATNFQTAQYRGEAVLAWWEGKVLPTGYGQGEVVIADHSYREVSRVRAANGRSADLHALCLTPEGTVLFTCYPELVPADLSSLRGPRRGQVLQSVIQEVDIASGRLLSEWRSLEHVPLSGSYQPVDPRYPYDYLHVNSISPASDGNLIVSARHTWSVYKLGRHSGELMWTLGGPHSQFRLDPRAQFSWQHDARQHPNGMLTIFDNGANGPTETERQSRALVLDVDETHRTVALRHSYTISKPLISTSMGSVQILGSGNVIVGWGTAQHTSEFAPDGRLLFDTSLPSDTYSYRGMWLPWKSVPRHSPAIAASPDRRTGAKMIYASWNGSTEVRAWRVDAGSRSDALHPIGIATRRGFETVIPLDPKFRYAAVTGIDHGGSTLTRSETVRV